VCVLFEIVDHGSRSGDAMRALARWWHPLALSEALDVLHQAMHPASYRCIAMAIEIVVDLPAFLSLPISLSPTTLAKSNREMIKLSTVGVVGVRRCPSVCQEFLFN
jgi:hypothetical protein